MTLGELKKHFQSKPDGTVFDYSLSDPFSWRGVYAEVCFSVTEDKSTKEENISKIEDALTNVFEGWKGGDYRYTEDTTVNFEETQRNWSDGDYVREMISVIEGSENFPDDETKLIRLAFS